MRIQQSAGTLTLEDSPGCHWLLGGILCGVGSLFIAGPLGLLASAGDLSLPAKALVLLLGCAAVAAGAWALYRAPLTSSRFDRQLGCVTVRRRGLFQGSPQECALAEIEAVHVAVEREEDGESIFQPYLLLRSGQTLPLSLGWMAGTEQIEGVVVSVQSFLEGDV